MAFSLTFDVLRFSQALTPQGPAKIEWTHTSGTHLQVVLEGSDNHYSTGMLRMDVFQGTTLLEHVNLAECIDISNRIRQDKIRTGTGLRIEDLEIFGITKDPTLALRYQIDSMTRRLQMRMKISQDFQQIVSILAKRGMEFSQQRPNTARPDSSSSRPSTMQQDDRSLINRTDEVGHQERTSAIPNPSPFRIPDLEAGSLSQRPIINVQPSTQRGGRLAGPAPESHSRPSPVEQSQPSQPSQPIRSGGYEMQHGLDAQASVISSGSNVDTKNPRYAAENFFQFSAAQTQKENSHRGSTLPQPRCWSSEGVPSHNSAASSDLIDPRPLTALSTTSATSIFPYTLEHEIPPKRVLPFKPTGNIRPSSAISIPSTASFTMSNRLENEIPPRRELPFKPPGSRGGGNAGAPRPGSALPLPPSKKARVSQQRPKTASSALELISEVNGPRSRQKDDEEPANITRLPGQSSLPFASSKPARPETEDGAKEPLSMKELMSGSSRLPNARPRVSSTMDAPYEIESPPTFPDRHHSAIHQAAHVEALSKVLSAEQNVSCEGSGDLVSSAYESHEITLDQYTSQTPEARQIALDQFMIDNLQNPSFTTLCEDTEHCWRRMALGL